MLTGPSSRAGIALGVVMARRPTARDRERVAAARPPRRRRPPRRLPGDALGVLASDVRLKRPTPWPNGSGTGISGDLDLVAPMTNIGRGLAKRLLAQHPQLV
jgi:hypothetical protein